MAKFLFMVWPFPGHVHPNVAVAQALASRGHEVAFYTGESIGAALRAEGFRMFAFRHLDEAGATDLVLRLDALSLEWRRPRERKALLREWLLGTAGAQIADLDDLLSAWRPDAMICDPAMWGPLLVAAETARIPLAVLSYVAACMLPGPEGPILGVPMRKPRGLAGRIGRRALQALGGIAAADVRRGAEALRAGRGLPPMGTSVTAFAGRAPLYLVPSSPSYDRARRDLPPSVSYVGPCEWDRPRASEAPSWIQALPGDRPVVYVTEGTMHSKEPLVLRSALKGLASMRASVIATTGKHRAPDSLGLIPVPANARIERFVPHSDLFPRTAVVVTTGGTGTVLGALCAGVPLVIVPTAWDQPENAWRVVEAGAGVRLTPKQATPARIRAMVEQVLSDGRYRTQAERLGRELSAMGGAARAADLLEALARRGAEGAVPGAAVNTQRAARQRQAAS